MRESFASLLATGAGRLTLSLLVASAPVASAYTFKQVPSPNLNIGSLGRVAFAGDFDSISLYEYEGQTQETPSRNGTLLSRYPNGVFASINTTDADIKAMCNMNINGTERLVFAGNFTGVGNMPTPGGIALLNTTDGRVQALEGLTGTVNALYCDKSSSQIYVGGLFDGLNSSNAIVWKDGWQELSFNGFNGPVHSITKTSNGNMIFGGEFTGIGRGNATVASENATQHIPIGSADISAQSSSGQTGFNDPKVIACKSDFSAGGAGQTWLLADNAPGSWKADFGFGFEPTRLKMYNTDTNGHGTKTFRFTALPDGSIMNMSYVDPRSGQQAFCDARCPLPEGNKTAQDFTFVNVVGMNSFRVDISEWYGNGGGLNGIQLFQDAMYSYAIDDFNEPKNCGPSTSARSMATATGNWRVTPSQNSYSEYLTTVLQGNPIDPQSASVSFSPDIKQSGNYSVTIYTPGCQGDGTCGSRARVNVTATMSRGVNEETFLWQTNNFDKYDEVYNGYIDVGSGFTPTVVLRPASGQGPGPLTFVAQRVRFTLLKATSGNINGLFEYKPGDKLDESTVQDSVINKAGASLAPRGKALITSVAAADDTLYVAGNFSNNDGRNNIFSVQRNSDNPTALPNKGLNSQVMSMYRNGSMLYVGGNFTNTGENNVQGLNGVAAFANDKWIPLGAGVNGVVLYLVPFALNITANQPEQVLAVSGFFNRVNAFEGSPATNVQDFAVWVPSRKNWLHNLSFYSLAMSGRLMTFADVPGSDRWFGGSVSSGSLLASGTAELQSNDGALALGAFPIDLQAQQGQQGTAPARKRAILDGQDLSTTGVRTGRFYNENGNNKTILAGHFATKGADDQNITNVVIIDGANSDRVTGFSDQLDANSTFTALAVQDNILYAGGTVTGRLDNTRIAGLVAYDLGTNKFTSVQPPPLQGSNVTVNSISPRPNSKDIYVAGQFQSAGSLGCDAVCIWNTERNQWNRPGNDLSGVVSSLTWVGDNKLYIAGNLTSGTNVTTILSYDSSSNQFTTIPGAINLPGPVNALTIATNAGDQLWAAGVGSDRAAFLQRYDGSKWLPVDSKLFGSDTDIRGIQVISLTESHESTDLIDGSQDLLLMGQINIPSFGTVSAALYNGTNLIPFLLATKGADGQTSDGSLSSIFVENPNSFFMQSEKHLALWAIVLIGLAIALVLTFLLVVAGIVLEWYRNKAKGYSPAPQSYPDRLGNVGRLPPEQLFGSLSGPRAPAI